MLTNSMYTFVSTFQQSAKRIQMQSQIQNESFEYKIEPFQKILPFNKIEPLHKLNIYFFLIFYVSLTAFPQQYFTNTFRTKTEADCTKVNECLF